MDRRTNEQTDGRMGKRMGWIVEWCKCLSYIYTHFALIWSNWQGFKWFYLSLSRFLFSKWESECILKRQLQQQQQRFIQNLKSNNNSFTQLAIDKNSRMLLISMQSVYIIFQIQPVAHVILKCYCWCCCCFTDWLFFMNWMRVRLIFKLEIIYFIDSNEFLLILFVGFVFIV